MYEMSFQSPEGEIFSFKVKINIKENRKENIREALMPYLTNHYIYILERNYSKEELYEKYKTNSEEELRKIAWKTDLPKYHCIGIKKITCYGCINGLLNQLGHTDIGGCIYSE